jgi:hypothetical protein
VRKFSWYGSPSLRLAHICRIFITHSMNFVKELHKQGVRRKSELPRRISEKAEEIFLGTLRSFADHCQI